MPLSMKQSLVLLTFLAFASSLNIASSIPHEPSYDHPVSGRNTAQVSTPTLRIINSRSPATVSPELNLNAPVSRAIWWAVPEIAAIVGSIAKALSTINLASNGDRTKFARNVINHVNSLGYNVVVVHPRSSGVGYEGKITLSLQYKGKGRKYIVYMARRNKMMQVTNHGDGGWINWALKGRWWVRWGKTVRFHNHWNYKTMGKPYEVRSGNPPPL